MAVVEITLTDEGDGSNPTVKPTFKVSMGPNDDPIGPATFATLLALTFKRKWEAGILEREVRFYCAAELAEIEAYRSALESPQDGGDREAVEALSVAPATNATSLSPADI